MTAANHAFLDELHQQNAASYGTSDGRGLLQLVPRSFEHRWIYLFELLQNALDCEATSIKVARTDSELVVEHNGKSPEQSHIESLSKVGRSTKGAATVGFMGVGFKSVFGRFRHVAISAEGWRIRFDVEEQLGQLGERIPDLMGMVLPRWDDDIEPPAPSFTTRFRFRRSWGEGDVETDLLHLIGDEHPDVLVPVALQGLRQLVLDERQWILDVHSDSFGEIVTATEGKVTHRWRCFERKYTPSKEAVVVFLQHRNIQVTNENRDKVYRDASRERSVVAFCSIDDASSPVLHDGHGRAFAVLPTDLRIPIGLHLQADWLLNLSRTGIRDTDDNQWQQEILQQAPYLIRTYLEWLASKNGAGPDWSNGYDALPDLDMPDDGRSIVRWFSSDDFKGLINEVLNNAEVFPFESDANQSGFASPSNLAVLPVSLGHVFADNVSLRPHDLFGTRVLAAATMGARACKFVYSLSLIPKLTASEMTDRWKDGLGFWLKEFAPERTATRLLDGETMATDAPRAELRSAERQAISALYAGLHGLESDPSWREAPLHIVPTRSGDWKARGDVQRLEGFEIPWEGRGFVAHVVRFAPRFVGSDGRAIVANPEERGVVLHCVDRQGTCGPRR